MKLIYDIISTLKTQQKSKKQQKIIYSIEAIANILRVETKNFNNEKSIYYLNKLLESFEKLFNLNINNEQKFEDIFNNDKDKNNKNIIIDDKNIHSLTFSTFLNSFKLIAQSAIDNKNEDILKIINLLLTKILYKLTSKDNNIETKEFIETFFEKHYKLFKQIIAKDLITELSLANHSWCFFIVFEQKFNIKLRYLDLIDRKFFNYYIRHIIDKNNFELFQNLIDFLHTNSNIPKEYHHNLPISLNIQYDKIKELKKLYISLETINQFEKFKEDFINLIENKNINENIDENLKNKTFENAIDNLLFNNTKNLFFGIGSYLVFKNKFEWIKFMYDYENPKLINTIWSGNNFIPKNLQEVLEINFDREESNNKFIYEKNRQDFKYYDIVYFLLLLNFVLKNMKQKDEELEEETFWVKEDSKKIENLKFHFENLTNIQNEILKYKKNIYKELGFRDYEIEKLDHKVKIFFQKLENIIYKKSEIKKNF